MAEAREGGRESEKPKTNTEKQRASLRYLKQKIDLSLHEDVETLLRFLEREEQKDIEGIERLRSSPRSEDPSTQTEINTYELRRRDIGRFKKLLIQHAENPNVQEVSAAMNELYETIFQASPSEEFTGESFPIKVRHFIENMRDAEPEYLRRNEIFDDTLDEAQTNHLMQLLETGSPDALFESYVTTIDRYEELLDKILLLPKGQRDKNIDVLLRTVSFYEALSTKEFEEAVKKEIQETAKQVLENQETQFKGLRGFIQRGIEKGTNFAIDHLSAVFGDKDSIARNLFIKAAKLGRDLSKPVTYDKQLIDEMAEETIAELQEIGKTVDADAAGEMKKAALELKANPGHLLSEDDRETFKEPFKDFLSATMPVQRKIIEVHGTLLRDAYIVSHGKNSNEFEADWNLRARFGSVQGRDLLRLMQVYSPFGIFLPDEISRKGDLSPIHIPSAYDRGWFKDHEYLSTALQAVEFNILLKAGRNVAYRLTVPWLIRRIAKESAKKFVLGPIGVVIDILTGFKAGKELDQYAWSKVEEDILEICSKYNSFREIPEDEQETIRQLLLVKEIHDRRKFAQPVGYNLGNFGVSLAKRFAVGNIGGGSLRKTMVEEGTFREAVLAANRKIVLMGFTPYEIKE